MDGPRAGRSFPFDRCAPDGRRGSARHVSGAFDARGSLQHSLGAGVRLCHAEYSEPGGAPLSNRRKIRLEFGEILAILVVLVSIVLLAWEMLYYFHILPFRLTPR
jgi:hypothetical protein